MKIGLVLVLFLAACSYSGEQTPLFHAAVQAPACLFLCITVVNAKGHTTTGEYYP